MLAIKIYWKAIPPNRRRDCIFHQSCSRHVYAILKQKGAYAGLKAFKLRFRQCRPGYHILLLPDQNYIMITADGSNISQEQICPRLLPQ